LSINNAINYLSEFTKHKRFKQFRNILAIIAVLRYGGSLFNLLRDYGVVRLVKKMTNSVKLKIFYFLRNYVLFGIIQKKVSAFKVDLENEFLGDEERRRNEPQFVDIPEVGMDQSEIVELLKIYKNIGDKKWEDGKVSGGVYHGGKDLTEVTYNAYKMFEWSNPLHPEIFEGIRNMEAEIVSMVVNLLHGDPNIQCGTMTTGGTESILMAIKTHKEWAKEVKGITKPNMIFPTTAHAAFDKACAFFNIEAIAAPLDPITFTVDVKKMKKLINRNTIMIVGSFPNYPYGTVDDISTLSKIALEKGIGLHVDCCLGSFIALFSESVGHEIPQFDFRLPGVTSISLDTHKYGFTPKGSSVVLYKNKELRQYQFFVQPAWPGGIYASPTLPGSKPGTVIATTWAVLMHFGKNGYKESCKKILDTRQKN